MHHILWLSVINLLIFHKFAAAEEVSSNLFVTVKKFKQNLERILTKLTSCSHDPENDMSTVEIIRNNGYPGEEHFVVTEDGYILSLQRIRGPEGSMPVLLHHGILDSSFGYIANGPEKSLAYILSRKGYDVWIGNSRGTTYSKNHTTLSTKDSKFWNFSFHEMGIYDLPADIKHIKSVTNCSSILYVGHSMGATKFLVLASTNPEIASSIKGAFLLAPVASLTHMKGTLRPIFLAANYFEKYTRFNKSFEVLPHNLLFKYIGKCLCNKPLFDKLCGEAVFFSFGGHLKNYNASRSSLIVSHTPAGISLKTFLHQGQYVPTTRFTYYDYGSEENQKIYGTKIVPEYDLSKIKVPIELYWAESDWLANEKNIKILYQKLSSVVDVIKIPPDFSHVDFIWGLNQVEVVYEKLLSNMEKYK